MYTFTENSLNGNNLEVYMFSINLDLTNNKSCEWGYKILRHPSLILWKCKNFSETRIVRDNFQFLAAYQSSLVTLATPENFLKGTVINHGHSSVKLRIKIFIVSPKPNSSTSAIIMMHGPVAYAGGLGGFNPPPPNRKKLLEKNDAISESSILTNNSSQK